MKPNFTQLEFMNELFTPHAQTFPFLNDVMEKHKDKKFHFIIGGTVGLSLDDIRITDKNGNTVEDVVWEPINPKKSSDYVLSEKESGIYSLYSSNNIFISTKSAYCPYDYTISLQKCELCLENICGEPACVKGCPNRAIVYEER